MAGTLGAIVRCPLCLWTIRFETVLGFQPDLLGNLVLERCLTARLKRVKKETVDETVDCPTKEILT